MFVDSAVGVFGPTGGGAIADTVPTATPSARNAEISHTKALIGFTRKPYGEGGGSVKQKWVVFIININLLTTLMRGSS